MKEERGGSRQGLYASNTGTFSEELTLLLLDVEEVTDKSHICC